MAIEYVDIEFRKSKEISKMACEQSSRSFYCLDVELFKDPAFVLSIRNLPTDGDTLSLIQRPACDDRQVVLRILAQDGLSLLYASKQMQNDLAVVRAAIANNPKAYIYAGASLKGHPDVVAAEASCRQ